MKWLYKILLKLQNLSEKSRGNEQSFQKCKNDIVRRE